MGIFDRLVSRFVGPSAPAPITDVRDAGSFHVDDPRNMDVISPEYGFGGANSLLNTMSGAGSSRDASVFAQWVAQRRLGRRELFALGRNALTARGLNLVGSTATREGWNVEIEDARVSDPQDLSVRIKQYEQRLGISGKVARASFRSRQYSHSIILLNIIDGRAWNEPVDVNAIESVRWAAVIDRRDFHIVKLHNIDQPEFSTPEVYRITDINGVLEDGLRHGDDLATLYSIVDSTLKQSNQARGYMEVHADRVLAFHTTDYYPLLEGMQDSLSAYFETTRGMQQWAREASMKIYKITDLFKKVFGNDAAKAYQRVALVEKLKSSLNAWVIDKGAEEVESASSAGGGIDKLADPFMVWVATSFGVPITQFWGVSPGGFGTGDSERATWHEEVRAFQDQTLAAANCLPKLHGYILAAADGGGLSTDIRRVIKFADLSPPDEEVRSKLRTESIGDLTTSFKEGGITRDEYRAGLERLSDDQFPFVRTSEGELVSRDAPVGVFTGSLEILKSAALGEIPVDSGQYLLEFLAPSSFTPERAKQIFDPLRAAKLAQTNSPPPTQSSDTSINASTFFSAGGQVSQGKLAPELFSAALQHYAPNDFPKPVAEALTSAALGGAPFPAPAFPPTEPAALAPTQTDDPTQAGPTPEEIEADAELTSLFSKLAVPSDAATADVVAEAVGNGATPEQIRRRAKQGDFATYPPEGFGSRPRFSVREVREAMLRRHGVLPSDATTPAVTSADAEQDLPLDVVCEWLRQHYSMAPKLTRPRIAKLMSAREAYPFLAAPKCEYVYRGLSNVRPSMVGKLLDETDPTRDKSWTTDIDQAIAFAAGKYIRPEDVDPEATGVVLIAKAEPERMLLNAEAIAEINEIADFVNPIWGTPLRAAILDEREVIVHGPLTVVQVRAVSMAHSSALTLDQANEQVQRAVKDHANAAADYSPTSACVVVELPSGLAEVFVPKVEDPSPPHVTVVYVADTQGRAEELYDTTLAVLAKWQPFDVTLPGTVAYFEDHPAGAGKRVAYAEVVAPMLDALHVALVFALREAGFVPSVRDVFTPHATLAYLAPGETYDGECPCGSWTASGAKVYLGDDAAREFPFGKSDLRAAVTQADADPKERIAEAFERYHETVNMGAAELREWSKSPWSKKASLSSAPIDRNLTLLSTPRAEWTLSHAKSAMRTVSFVSRMRGAEQGEPVKIDGREGPSRRDISLKNWAFDPSK